MVSKDERRLMLINHVTYALYLVSFFTAGLLWIVPIIMNYLFRGDAKGTWLASHFRWQIMTFWLSIVFVVVGFIIIAFALGGFSFAYFADISSNTLTGGSLLILFAGIGVVLLSFLWHLYRIVRGWVALADKTSVPK